MGFGAHAQHQGSHNAFFAVWERGVGGGVGLPRPTPLFPQCSFCCVGARCWGWVWASTPNTNAPTRQFLLCGNVVFGVGSGSHAQHQCSHNAVFALWERGVGEALTHALVLLLLPSLLLQLLTPMFPQCSFCCVERGVGRGCGLPRPTPMFPQCSFCSVGTWCSGWGRVPTPNTNAPTMELFPCGSIAAAVAAAAVLL